MSLARWLNVVRSRRLDRQLDEELRHHLEALEAEYRSRGLSADDARRAARRDMGGLTQAREAHRDVRSLPALEVLWRNLRFGLRSLRRTPTVTGAVLATLAIGIGANTAIFTIVDDVLIKPLPYPDASRLVAVMHRSPAAAEEIPSAPYLYFTYRDESRSLESVGLWRSGPATVTGLDRPEQVQALVVTREILPILGIPPLAGRVFSERDDTPDSPATVMLTFGYWQRRFGGDLSVIGRMLTVDGQSLEIIGVLPQRFRFLDRPIDLVYPFQLDQSSVTLGRYVFQSLARLRPGASVLQASADLARIVPLAIARFPPPTGYTRAQFARRPMIPIVRPLKDVVVGDSGRMLWIVMGALGLVMLIVCANVANLLLVRADGRRQELAVRAALGASWARIAGELLVESVLLGLAGGVAGLALAYGGLRVVLSLSGANLPRVEEVGIDRVALIFTCGVSLLAGICFGLFPVVRYANPRLATSLAGGGRTISDGRDRQRTRGFLVITQVAMSLVLLVCSGLMIRTFVALNRVDPGFTHPETIQLVQTDASSQEFERTTRTQQAIVDRVAAIPGVTSVAFADLAPLGANNSGSDTVLTVIARPTPMVSRARCAASS